MNETPHSAPAVSPIYSALLKWALWAFVAITVGIHGIYRPLTIFGVDYYKHWLAARAVVNGESVYLGDWLWLGFNYPQWSALVTFWLGWLPQQAAQDTWKMMHLLMIVGCWWMGRGLFVPGRRYEKSELPAHSTSDLLPSGVRANWTLAVAFLTAAFSPAVAISLYVGQIEPANAFLSVAFFGALMLKREKLAGVYLAMLCLIKMMPVVWIVPIVLWRRWDVMKGWFAFMAGYFLILVATGRVGYEWFFVTEMMDKIAFEWRNISISIPHYILRQFFPSNWYEDPALHGRVLKIVLGMLIVIYLAGIGLMRRRRVELLDVLAWAAIFMPLMSPLFEPHHVAIALPVLYLHAGRFAAGQMKWGRALPLAVGWIAICMNYVYRNFMQNVGEWWQYPTLFAVIFLAIVTFADNILESKSSASEA